MSIPELLLITEDSSITKELSTAQKKFIKKVMHINPEQIHNQRVDDINCKSKPDCISVFYPSKSYQVKLKKLIREECEKILNS
jgi:hypothetical protein